MHLEQTPVAGEEVGREDEDCEAGHVDALPDRLLQHAAGQEVPVVDHRRDPTVFQVLQQIVADPRAVVGIVADEGVALVHTVAGG